MGKGDPSSYFSTAINYRNGSDLRMHWERVWLAIYSIPVSLLLTQVSLTSVPVRGGEFRKKLWCCVGGKYNKIIWLCVPTSGTFKNREVISKEHIIPLLCLYVLAQSAKLNESLIKGASF